MRMWMDTEFMEDGKTIDLLSIGIVREDGQEYYAVSADADVAKANDWVKKNVLPHLDFTKAKPRSQIRDEVQAFVTSDGNKPEIWAYYGSYDWVAFCQLFGMMVDLPKGMPKYARDIKQLCAYVGDPELPEQKSTEHHALADAKWNKDAWEFCESRRKRMYIGAAAL